MLALIKRNRSVYRIRIFLSEEKSFTGSFGHLNDELSNIWEVSRCLCSRRLLVSYQADYNLTLRHREVVHDDR